MKKKYTDEQIVIILEEANSYEGTIEDYCRIKQLSPQTYYKWKRKFNGVNVSEVKRLRELEKENSRLKKLVAERDLDIEILKEALGKKL